MIWKLIGPVEMSVALGVLGRESAEDMKAGPDRVPETIVLAAREVWGGLQLGVALITQQVVEQVFESAHANFDAGRKDRVLYWNPASLP